MAFRVSIRNVQQVGPKTAGWSDNFWTQISELSAADTKTRELAAALNLVVGNQTLVPSARISNPDSFRQVQLINIPGAVVGTTSGYDSDYASTALLLKLTAPGPYTTLQWIRGVPDSIITQGGKYTPSALAGFTTRLNSFLGLLTSSANLWSIRALSRSVLPTPITGIALQTGIVTAPAHGLGAAGAIVQVRIKGFKVPEGLNRVWRATVLTDSTFQLNFYTPPLDTTLTPFGLNPTVRKQTYTYVQIAGAEIVRATAHYTGRPTELLGGRRRTRRSSQAGQPVDA